MYLQLAGWYLNFSMEMQVLNFLHKGFIKSYICVGQNCRNPDLFSFLLWNLLGSGSGSGSRWDEEALIRATRRVKNKDVEQTLLWIWAPAAWRLRWLMRWAAAAAGPEVSLVFLVSLPCKQLQILIITLGHVMQHLARWCCHLVTTETGV